MKLLWRVTFSKLSRTREILTKKYRGLIFQDLFCLTHCVTLPFKASPNRREWQSNVLLICSIQTILNCNKVLSGFLQSLLQSAQSILSKKGLVEDFTRISLTLWMTKCFSFLVLFLGGYQYWKLFGVVLSYIELFEFL